MPTISHGAWWPSFWPMYRPYYTNTELWQQQSGVLPSTATFLSERLSEGTIKMSYRRNSPTAISLFTSRTWIDGNRLSMYRYGGLLSHGYSGENMEGYAGINVFTRTSGNSRPIYAPTISVGSRRPGWMLGFDYSFYIQGQSPTKLTWESKAGYWNSKDLWTYGIYGGIGLHTIFGGQGQPPEPLIQSQPVVYDNVSMEEVTTFYPMLKVLLSRGFFNTTLGLEMPFTYIRTENKVSRIQRKTGRWSLRSKGYEEQQKYFKRLEIGSPAFTMSAEFAL